MKIFVTRTLFLCWSILHDFLFLSRRINPHFSEKGKAKFFRFEFFGRTAKPETWLLIHVKLLVSCVFLLWVPCQRPKNEKSLELKFFWSGRTWNFFTTVYHSFVLIEWARKTCFSTISNGFVFFSCAGIVALVCESLNKPFFVDWNSKFSNRK